MHISKSRYIFPPRSSLPRPSEGGHLPSASPSFSSTSQGRPRAAGGPQRLFVSLFTSRRAPESLFTDCSNLPLFPLCSLSLHPLLPPQSSPSHSHGPRSRSLPCSPPCHQSQGRGEQKLPASHAMPFPPPNPNADDEYDVLPDITSAFCCCCRVRPPEDNKQTRVDVSDRFHTQNLTSHRTLSLFISIVRRRRKKHNNKLLCRVLRYAGRCAHVIEITCISPASSRPHVCIRCARPTPSVPSMQLVLIKLSLQFIFRGEWLLFFFIF